MDNPGGELMIQVFNKNTFSSTFPEDNIPHLVYSCNVESHHNALPRVLHMHPDKLEIIFIVSGQGIHLIGDQKYYTKRGNVLIYNQGVLHDENSVPEENLNVYCIAVNNLKLKGLPPNHLIALNKEAVISVNEFYDDFHHLFKMIHQSTDMHSPINGEINNYLTRVLLLRILDHTKNVPLLVESENRIIGRRVKNYIDLNFMEEHINLCKIAEASHLSQYYLSHIFKKMTGFSPMQYVIKRRIGEAQSLLINTDLPVTEIALMVGYKNSNHFHSAFSKIVGTTPGGYRKYWIATYKHKHPISKNPIG